MIFSDKHILDIRNESNIFSSNSEAGHAARGRWRAAWRSYGDLFVLQLVVQPLQLRMDATGVVQERMLCFHGMESPRWSQLPEE